MQRKLSGRSEACHDDLGQFLVARPGEVNAVFSIKFYKIRRTFEINEVVLLF